MRKFKLIKGYPNSPKIGYIKNISSTINNLEREYTDFPEYWEEIIEYPIGTKVLNSNTNTIYTKKEDGWYRPSEKTSYTDEMIRNAKCISIINEKVVEKEYEILSLKYSTNVYTNLRGKIFNSLLLNMKNDSEIKIQSIKRLSDGEIFTVGDKLTEGIILEITLSKYNNGIYVNTKNYNGLPLDECIKVKQPLFTTEDGVDIFEEGTKIFEVNRNFNHSTNIIRICKPFNKNYPVEHWFKGTKYFSTKEAAEEYILMNKPIFTATDILLYLDIFGNIVKDVQKERVKTIAKSKL